MGSVSSSSVHSVGYMRNKTIKYLIASYNDRGRVAVHVKYDLLGWSFAEDPVHARPS